MGGVCCGVSGQRLADRVVEALGEGLVVLPAGECDGGWSGLAGGHVRLPGVAGLGECEGLAVHAGCFQNGCLCGVGPCRLAGLALLIQTPLV